MSKKKINNKLGTIKAVDTLTAQKVIAKVKKQQAEQKAKKDNEMKAQSVIPSKEELQKEIKNKIKVKIQRQNDFRESWLKSELRASELAEFQKQINTNQIFLRWQGMPCPKLIAIAQHDVMLHAYKIMLTRVSYLRQALYNIGLSPEQVVDIKNGKIFIKESDFVEPEELVDDLLEFNWNDEEIKKMD